MGGIRRRILVLAPCLAVGVCFVGEGRPARFLSDDPLLSEPAPRNVGELKVWDVDKIYDLIDQIFVQPRLERNKELGDHPAGNVNTLGDVPDCAWYTSRHWLHRMSIDELVRGPGNANPPDTASPWQVVSGKVNGVTPGFVVKDGRGQRYLLKFDSVRDPETATAADVIGSKFLYALGYNVPENYIVRFRRDQLAIDNRSTYRDSAGRKRSLARADIDRMLDPLPKDNQGRYRAMASRFIQGSILGPFSYTGTRSDDPNDIVPHEDRRELRGQRVFYAWLNNTDAKVQNSLDTIVEENGRRFVRHFLIDFSASLGTDGYDAKDPRLGHEYFVDLKPTLVQIATLGLYVPRWARAVYPRIRGVGRFEFSIFDPATWKPNYPNPAFDLMDWDDAFWAAKQVASFTDEEIRAIVQTGQFSDPRAVDRITTCLIERRNKIATTYLDGTAPLDGFRVEDGALRYAQLGLSQSSPNDWVVKWHQFDNETGALTPIAGADGANVVSALARAPGSSYMAADFQSPSLPERHVRVYLRREGMSAIVVGMDRDYLKVESSISTLE